MSSRSFLSWMAVLLTVACAAAALAAQRPALPQKQAVEKALVFLQNEAIQWNKEHRCTSCSLVGVLPPLPKKTRICEIAEAPNIYSLLLSVQKTFF